MQTWLFKTEPEEYSWEQLEKDGKTMWTGIRNFEARNNIRQMQPGDLVFIYHSGEEKIVMGLARVTSAAVADDTAEKGDWSAIEIEAIKPLTRPVSLEEIRNTYTLNTMPLISQTRLSVVPVTEPQKDMLLKIAKTTL